MMNLLSMNSKGLWEPMNKVPVRNIYYLILYAFGAIKDRTTLSSKDLEENDSFQDVLVKLFIHEVEKIIKRGIYQDYTGIENETQFIRGRFNLKKSLINPKRKIICSYDEFINHQACNKMIKYTLNKLLLSNNIDSMTKRKLRTVYFYFESVPFENFSIKEIENIPLNRLNKHYEIALQFALFLNYEMIPKNTHGQYSFIQIFENEETMSKIYEAFLYNFYAVNLDNKYAVKNGSRFDWELTKLDDTSSNLPKMVTDIEIKHSDKFIVIDAKYYKDAFSNYHQARKFRSTHLYQMHAYLSYYQNKHENLHGILLYPSNGYNFNESYNKENEYRLSFSTVNLSNNWDEIHESLLDIVK